MTFAKTTILAFGLGMALSGCGEAEEERTQPPAADGASLIECALGDGSAFAEVCFLEEVASDEEGEFAGLAALMLRAPDGGYRRFYVDPDGAGLIAADGADVSVNTLSADGAVLEVRVADDRYRLPTRTAKSVPENAG